MIIQELQIFIDVLPTDIYIFIYMYIYIIIKYTLRLKLLLFVLVNLHLGWNICSFDKRKQQQQKNNSNFGIETFEKPLFKYIIKINIHTCMYMYV